MYTPFETDVVSFGFVAYVLVCVCVGFCDISKRGRVPFHYLDILGSHVHFAKSSVRLLENRELLFIVCDFVVIINYFF